MFREVPSASSAEVPALSEALMMLAGAAHVVRRDFAWANASPLTPEGFQNRTEVLLRAAGILASVRDSRAPTAGEAHLFLEVALTYLPLAYSPASGLWSVLNLPTLRRLNHLAGQQPANDITWNMDLSN